MKHEKKLDIDNNTVWVFFYYGYIQMELPLYIAVLIVTWWYTVRRDLKSEFSTLCMILLSKYIYI